MSAPDLIEEVAERIGRLAVSDMLVLDEGERATAEIGGFLAAAMVLDAALDYMSAFAPEDVVSAFVDRLRTNVARYEEMAA